VSENLGPLILTSNQTTIIAGGELLSLRFCPYVSATTPVVKRVAPASGFKTGAPDPYQSSWMENRTHPKNNHFIGKVSENEAKTSHFLIGKVVTGQWNPMDLMPYFQTNPFHHQKHDLSTQQGLIARDLLRLLLPHRPQLDWGSTCAGTKLPAPQLELLQVEPGRVANSGGKNPPIFGMSKLKSIETVPTNRIARFVGCFGEHTKDMRKSAKRNCTGAGAFSFGRGIEI